MTLIDNQVSIYNELIERIKANMNYKLNQLKRRKEAVKEYKKSIKKYEAKVKELEAK